MKHRRKNTVCVGIGMTSDQEIPYLVLEHSIKSNNGKLCDITIVRLDELNDKRLKTKQGEQRTPFSLQRFLLAQHVLSENYEYGIYLDSDMLVLSDISALVDYVHASLFEIETVKVEEYWHRKSQTSVMVMSKIGARMLADAFDAYMKDELNYDQLLYLQNLDYGRSIPSHWNSLEYFDANTKLIHWTDVDTQPWLKKGNPNAGVWYSALYELSKMQPGVTDALRKHIHYGNVLPSLEEIILFSPSITSFSLKTQVLDIFFIPPPRIRSIKNRKIRKVLGPIFVIYRTLQFFLKKGQLNVR